MNDRKITFSWTVNCATPEVERAARYMFLSMARTTYHKHYSTIEPIKLLAKNNLYSGSLNTLKIETKGAYQKQLNLELN